MILQIRTFPELVKYKNQQENKTQKRWQNIEISVDEKKKLKCYNKKTQHLFGVIFKKSKIFSPAEETIRKLKQLENGLNTLN